MDFIRECYIIMNVLKEIKTNLKVGVTHVIFFQLRKIVIGLSMDSFVLSIWVSNARYQINVKQFEK